MTFTDAAAIILGQENRAMSAEEIAQKAIAQGLISTAGKTPGATMYSLLWGENQRLGAHSRFAKVGPNQFMLTAHLSEQVRVRQNDPGMYQFTIDGRLFQLSPEYVVHAARSALKEGRKEGARDYTRWYLIVDGQSVSVKWVLAVATGLPLQAFTSDRARHILSQMGLRPRRVAFPPAEPEESLAARTDLAPGDFVEEVITGLRMELPRQLQAFDYKMADNYAHTQLYYGETSVHYEMWFHKRRGLPVEIGLHFESSRRRNQALLDHFRPIAGELGSRLGMPVQAEPWGGTWSRVYTSLPRRPLTAAWATELARHCAAFITATYPTLQAALQAVPGKKHGPHAQTQDEVDRWQAILVDRVGSIRAYLNGSSGHLPGQETICSWVEFCYVFELFDEGAALFDRVGEDSINEWLYEKTKKIALACRHRRAEA